MRIYTRQGDDGHTRLADGSQRAKDDIRVESYGAIDELNKQGNPPALPGDSLGLTV